MFENGGKNNNKKTHNFIFLLIHHLDTLYFCDCVNKMLLLGRNFAIFSTWEHHSTVQVIPSSCENTVSNCMFVIEVIQIAMESNQVQLILF